MMSIFINKGKITKFYQESKKDVIIAIYYH